MRDIIVRLVWKFLGYGCCRPVHSHEVQGIMERYQKNMAAQMSDQRAQLIEYMQKMHEADEARIVEVRLVK